MKTTLEIPDPTFRKAKATASALGIPLRDISQMGRGESGLVPPSRHRNCDESTRRALRGLRVSRQLDRRAQLPVGA